MLSVQKIKSIVDRLMLNLFLFQNRPGSNKAKTNEIIKKILILQNLCVFYLQVF